MKYVQKQLATPDTNIMYYTWPVEVPQAVLIFIHGLKSHAGWFFDAGEALAARGIKTFAFDRRGSGLSQEPRGDIDNYGSWSEDIDAIVTKAQTQYTNVPIHILGHCFGSKLALAYGLIHPEKIRSLCLIAPTQRALKVTIRPWEKLEVVWNELLGKNTYVKVPIADDMFTDDPEYLEFIKNDKLKLEAMTTHFCWEIFKLDRWVGRHIQSLNLPLLCLLAANDDIIDTDRAQHRFYNTLTINKKELAVFNCRHHLLFEPRREEVLSRIERWICLGD